MLSINLFYREIFLTAHQYRGENALFTKVFNLVKTPQKSRTLGSLVNVNSNFLEQSVCVLK